MVDEAGALSDLDAATLTPLVQNLLGEPAAAIAEHWSCSPLGGGAGEGLGLYRLSGSARVGSATRAWALVVKVCAAQSTAAPDAWDYPAREALAYGSGLLAGLPGGLAAPRCLAVESQSDGRTRLWLEAIVDVHPGPWSRERFALVARDLGRVSGAYLSGAPLPNQPWLSRGWLRDFVKPSGAALAELKRLTGPAASPLARRLYPMPVVAEIERLWSERERFLTALDQLPRTFCHHDAFRRNLLHRAGPAGDDLVAVDWAYTGHGAVGEELGQLVVGSLFFFEVLDATPRELDAACLAGFVAGLREEGWTGDERVVRLGYTAAAALRHTVGLLHLIVPGLTDPALRPFVEDTWGRPLEAVLDGWAELWPFQFELAEEARALMLSLN